MSDLPSDLAVVMPVTVDGRPTHVTFSEAPASTPREKIERYLGEAALAIQHVPHFREAYRVNQQVEALRAAAKAYGLADRLQRQAGEVAIRCLLSLGQALRRDFPKQSARTISQETELPYKVVRSALSISRYTWHQVTSATRDILHLEQMPSVSLVIATLSQGEPYQELRAQRKLSLVTSNEDAFEKQAQALCMMLKSYTRFPSSVGENYMSNVFARQEVRDSLAKALVANRKAQRALQTLAASAQSVRHLVRTEDGESADA